VHALDERDGEGLFIKNLENVQGDERDHIIISTTYGPDPKGKFYRRFGPLLRAGGGRRLNVLVTRARSKVHLVTSIPQGEYVALPPVEAGRTPNGAWLLFSYLQYAEHLEKVYADEANERRAAAAEAVRAIRQFQTRTPSQLVASLATRIAEDRGLTSDVYWGNDGFCVDLALHHPTQADNVTIGVLCDGTRYDKVDDPVEWDLFRVHVLESQGWNLLRVWSPHLVRDRAALIEAIHKEAVRESGGEAHHVRAPAPAALPTARLLNLGRAA
jgi:very-short-patch-repair endonuclease